MTELKDHEIANIFPLMDELEIKELAADIQANGLKTPLILLDNKILDGRNRYRACVLSNVYAQRVQYNGTNPVQDVLSWNLKRRHLSASQRAAVAVEALPHLEPSRKKIASAERRLIKEIERGRKILKSFSKPPRT